MLLKVVRPISKLIGMIHAPFSHKKVCAKDYHLIQGMALPGDILLSHTCGELTNYFIPGPWKHSAVMGFDGKVIEAVGSGVRMVDLFDFLRTKDYVAHLRPNLGEAVRASAAVYALGCVGSGYDYEFESKDKEFYCSELVNTSYKEAGFELVQGKARVLPSDFAVFPKLYVSGTIG